MAEMVPETISSTSRATEGERRVFRVLRDALQPDEDFVVWFEPNPTKKRPDFLIWSHDFGLLVVEVKDWGWNSIRYMDPKQWEVKRKGAFELCDSPIEQAHKCFIQLKDLLEKNAGLCHQNPEKPGRLRFPIGYTAIFTNIERSLAAEHRMLEVLKSTPCLFADDLKLDCNDRAARREFISKLQRAFKTPFPFEPLSPVEFKLLRFLIFPEVRIKAIRKLRSGDEAQMIQALDLSQERVAKSIPEGHRVLKGVAGSGKTLVVSCRARYLAQLYPHWRILVVCYGISFSQYLRQLISNAEPQGSLKNIEIFHYHELVKKLTGKNLQQFAPETRSEWDARVGRILLNALLNGAVTSRYDAVLIDEGQDFTVEWLLSLSRLLNPETDSLLLCIDPAQNIFGRQTTYKSAGIKVQGKRPVVLKRSYRNTVEILELARTFSKVPEELAEVMEEEQQFSAPLFPMDTNRHGEPPVILQNLEPDEQIRFVLDEIEQHITNGSCSWCDIGVLYVAAPSRSFLHDFSEVFARRFGHGRLYWITADRKAKLGLDVVSDSVKLSTVESIKGMEFKIIFLLGLEQLPRPDRDGESERKLVYVGLTRAQDVLYIVGHVPTGFFREILAVGSELKVGTFPGQAAHAPSFLGFRNESQPNYGNGTSARNVMVEQTPVPATASSANSEALPVWRGTYERRVRLAVRLGEHGLATAFDFSAFFNSPLATLCNNLLRHRLCCTASEAEDVADRVAEALGLPEKEMRPKEYINERKYIYSDARRFLRLFVATWAPLGDAQSYKDGMYWSFQCYAVRDDVGEGRSASDDRWREDADLFAQDAWHFVNDLTSLQLEGNGRFLAELGFWDPKQAFGFLRAPGFGEIFFRQNAVRPSDRQYLKEGELFSFRHRASDKKPGRIEAVEVEHRVRRDIHESGICNSGNFPQATQIDKRNPSN